VLIEDMDGAENVLYPLRELQSKRRISKTIPIKDNKGNLKTITLQVEGPICLAGTTTRERLYEDNANRSLLIYLDSSREHKELIMDYQRKLSAGKIDTKKEMELKELFRDMQTLIRPIRIRNPFAEELKIPDHIFKPLRTNSHYLAFIETLTFYNQWQRQVKTDRSSGEQYIETTLEDIRWANLLLKDVLLVKSDELPKAVRDFFEGVKYHLKSKGKESFYSREIRSHLRINPMTVNRYVRELEARSFIRRVGGNRKTGYEYEILSWDDFDRLEGGIKVLDQIYYELEGKYNRSITSRDVTLKALEVPAS
jgi:predicted transcriptional regulator